MSRLITKNDKDDFPLLVDDTEDDMFHDSYQVLGMEQGGNHSSSFSNSNNNSTSSSNDLLMDILSTSFQGPSEEHTEFLHGKRRPHHHHRQHSRNNSDFKQQLGVQSKKREELEDLYSFSVSEDDDPMLDLFDDDDQLKDDEEEDDDSDGGDDRRLQYFNSSQDMDDEDMIMMPYSYKNDNPTPYGGEKLEPLLYDPFQTKQGEDDDDAPRQRTVRFADDESQSRLFQDDPMMQEDSLVLMTSEEKLLDIFDQQGAAVTRTLVVQLVCSRMILMENPVI